MPACSSSPSTCSSSGCTTPAGGFAAGLVAGTGLVLRRLAGGPWELGEAAPVPPGVLLGAGLSLAAGYGLAGVVVADEFLAGTVWRFPEGPFGHIEVPTSLILEVGIALIVIGLVLDVLRTLGAEQRPAPPAPASGTDREDAR
ncbi:MnhB domain-containing protein [Thermobifida halotolerans]|uniref:MnhB domain-containing protein n=1 Tax=Thermobifida halotolerans TaxID=483545 RepID=UPI003518EF84